MGRVASRMVCDPPRPMQTVVNTIRQKKTGARKVAYMRRAGLGHRHRCPGQSSRACSGPTTVVQETISLAERSALGAGNDYTTAKKWGFPES